MSNISFESVPLHEHTEFLNSCVDVLKEEWNRSTAARCFVMPQSWHVEGTGSPSSRLSRTVYVGDLFKHTVLKLSMLEKSNDELPYSLVLLEKKLGEETCELIGHSRICKVFSEPHAGFVESVVIRKNRRGLGLGRKLMEETEKHAAKCGLKVLYLTTHDKQGFYERLGFEYCSPIVSFGSASGLLSEEQLASLVNGLGVKVNSPSERNTKTVLLSTENGSHVDRSEGDDGSITNSCSPRISPPAPPPPPPPIPVSAPKTVTKITCYWMKKVLLL